MSYEPISQQTYRDHRVLLGLSTVAVLVEVFQIEVGELPLAGVSITAPDRLISTGLAGAIIYLLIAFLLRLWKDLRNKAEEPHQSRRRDQVMKTIDDLAEDLYREVLPNVTDALGAQRQSKPLRPLKDWLDAYIRGAENDPKTDSEVARRMGTVRNLANALGIENLTNEAAGAVDRILLEAAVSARSLRTRSQSDHQNEWAALRRSRLPEQLHLWFEATFPVIWSVFALSLLSGLCDGATIAGVLGLGSPESVPLYKGQGAS
ncbi:MAG: hypothetical protein MJA83_11485 [Gammaproteobacteria bacterium]|nr:hypothetical protein [Gammaproteobacteria bacterium]